MAVPRFAPVLIVDGVIRESRVREFTDRETGVVQPRGRVAILQTSRGFVEVAFGNDDNDVLLREGQRMTCFVELSEWSMANGRSGSTLTYADMVTRGHLEEIANALPQPVAAKQ